MFKPKVSYISTTLRDAVFGDNRCLINVLVVADGKLDFSDGRGFGLTLFCEALEKSALPWETIKVTTAHRSPKDPPTGAEIPCFKFDDVDNHGVPIFSISRFDQLWLFGSEGERSKFILTPSELERITEFMNAGGGVFATGDHEDLGYALCGTVPRVRKMRRWYFHCPPRDEPSAPAQFGPTRIDSLREGTSLGFQVGDEEDDVPQEIRPKFFVNKCETAAEPHPLLAIREFAITVLPDHMHEGECISPKEIESKLANEDRASDDFPLGRDRNVRTLPQIVAISTSAGGMFLKDDKDPVSPVEPRCYLIITAYDGHLVEQANKGGELFQLGRVVVDASFHHFVNLNLIKLKENTSSTNFEAICKYYRNILTWLLPPHKKLPYYLFLLLGLRYSPPLLEEIRKRPAAGLRDILYAGRVTKSAIQANLSSAEARLCALALAETQSIEMKQPLEAFIDVWQSRQEPTTGECLFDSEKVLLIVLGSAMLGIATQLSESPYEANEILARLEKENKNLRSMVSQGVEEAVVLLQNATKELSRSLKTFSDIRIDTKG